MPAALAFIIIPTPCWVRGKLQRESRGRATRQAQQDDECTALNIFLSTAYNDFLRSRP
jgi:hypothetical protein